MGAVLGWLLVHDCAGVDFALEVVNIASNVQMRHCTVFLGDGLAVKGSARIVTSVRQSHCILAVFGVILLAFGGSMVGCIFRICTCGVSQVAGLTVRGRGRRHCHRKVVVYRRNFFSGVAGSAAQVGPPSLRVVPGSTECVGDGGGWEVCRSVLAETTSMSCRSTFVRFLAEAPPPPADV